MGPSPARAQNQRKLWSAFCFWGPGIHRSSDGGSRRFWDKAWKWSAWTSGFRRLWEGEPGRDSSGRSPAWPRRSAKPCQPGICARVGSSLCPAMSMSWSCRLRSREITSPTCRTSRRPRARSFRCSRRTICFSVIESTSPVGTTDRMARLIFAERPELEGKLYSRSLLSRAGAAGQRALRAGA